MRFQTRTRHAVQALFDIAFHARGGQVQAREIAERQVVPIRYLEEVLQDLRRAGLIHGQRGPKGGYSLARAPEAISIEDVLRAVDPPSAESSPAAGDAGAARSTPAAEPAFHLIWSEMGARLSELFSQMTLSELVTRAETAGMRRATGQPTMYFI